MTSKNSPIGWMFKIKNLFKNDPPQLLEEGALCFNEEFDNWEVKLDELTCEIVKEQLGIIRGTSEAIRQGLGLTIPELIERLKTSRQEHAKITAAIEEISYQIDLISKNIERIQQGTTNKRDIVSRHASDEGRGMPEYDQPEKLLWTNSDTQLDLVVRTIGKQSGIVKKGIDGLNGYLNDRVWFVFVPPKDDGKYDASVLQAGAIKKVNDARNGKYPHVFLVIEGEILEKQLASARNYAANTYIAISKSRRLCYDYSAYLKTEGPEYFQK